MTLSDKDFIGLEVVGLDDAVILGQVAGLIVDDKTRSVAALVIDTGAYRMSVLPYEAVRSVGTDALVIGSSEELKLVTDVPEIDALARRRVQLPGRFVLADNGTVLGVVDHILIDEDSGRLTQLVVELEDEENSRAEVNAEDMLTVGEEIVIVKASETAPYYPTHGEPIADSELIGLQIVAFDSAEVVGQVDGLILDDKNLTLAGFLVDLGLYDPKVLPRENTRVIGRDTILVDSADAITTLEQNTRLAELAQRQVELAGARAVTVTGRSVGRVLHFYVEPTDGSLVALEFAVSPGSKNEEQTQLLPFASVMRIGKGLVVLSEDFAEHIKGAERSQAKLDMEALSERQMHAAQAEFAPAEISQPASPVDSAARHFLLGKTVLRRLQLPGGKVIAEAGETVTPELIRRAKDHNMLLVLSLNVE